MKIFLDTARIDEVKQWVDTGLVDGITTNPSHLSTQGNQPTQIIAQLSQLLPNKPISVQVTEHEPEAVYKQAHAIARLGSSIVVKIPCKREYYSIIRRLVEEGILVNVTLVFTLEQSLFMCKLGAHYISPFIGRWDDLDVDGSQILYRIRAMIDTYHYNTQLLAASLRHMRHLHAAITARVDIVTLPVTLLEQATAHLLTDAGDKKFTQDWQKLSGAIFP
ncbi:fructose-6-phosphate aldolase [Vermiphilus pyriformis]|nr:MAG: fructose-6-phosphate aldolase [Vermiphilus pyriformis]